MWKKCVSGLAVILVSLLMSSIHAAQAAENTESAFRKIGTFHAIGGVKGLATGPGSTPGSRLLYVDYMYIGDTIEIVAVDPVTGKLTTFANPVPGESGSYGLIEGPDGNMYMGSLPNAHLYCLDTKTQQLKDLGMPCPGESYVWDIAVAPDKKLYGVTYPRCKLFSYDPATKEMRDLGRMDPKEQYARYVAADDVGFIYVATGTVNGGIVAYNIATGKFAQILTDADRGRGFYKVYRGSDGKAYAIGFGHAFHLQNGHAVKLTEGEKAPPAQSKVLLADGSTVGIGGRPPAAQTIQTARGGKVVKSIPYLYEGRALNIFRFTATPQGMLYGSSVLPLYFFSLDPQTSQFASIGYWGGGESYSLIPHRGKVLLASYSANAILMAYDPSRPLKAGGTINDNPVHASYEGADHAWRPAAMIEGKDGKVYAGATAGYGALGGTLAVWDTATNEVQAIENPVKDQSVASLAAAPDGSIYGGTSIGGGGGTVATQKEAVLFQFDPASHKVTSQLVPVPGAKSITDLLMTPQGKLMGFAGDTLFVYDPQTRQIIHRQKTALGGLIYNSVVIGADQQIYGLSSDGIFSINPQNYHVREIAKAPVKITSGGALVGNQFYFANLGTVYVYTLPFKSP